MVYHEIKIEDSDYKYLKKSAKIAGLDIEKYLKQLILNQQNSKTKVTTEKISEPGKSRWAKLSEKIRQNPPLRGAGEYLFQSTENFKKEFSFKHDEE